MSSHNFKPEVGSPRERLVPLLLLLSPKNADRLARLTEAGFHNLLRLSQLFGPFWSVELAICRAYFESPRRTNESDALWLKHQCWKEIHGSGIYIGLQILLKKLSDDFKHFGDPGFLTPHEALHQLEEAYEEFGHFVLFADAFAAITGSQLKISQLSEWESDRLLKEYRDDVRGQFGLLGSLIVACTEGGFGTLYFAGYERKLLPNASKIDVLIADACQPVFKEEIGHGFSPILRLSAMDLSEQDWIVIETQIPKIMNLRLKMRNEQFGFPFPDASLSEQLKIIDPLPIDWMRAWLDHSSV